MDTVSTAARRVVPGLALAGALAAAAFAVRHALGMAARAAAGMPARMRPGVGLAARTLLRLAVVLLGAQVTLAQVGAIGGGGVAVLAAALGSTFLFTVWLGRALRVGQGVGVLIAAGTSICGASAGEIGTVAKLARVVMLAPVVMALGLWLARRRGGEGGSGAVRPPFPWFIVGSAALMLVNSLFPLPAAVTAAAFLASLGGGDQAAWSRNRP